MEEGSATEFQDWEVLHEDDDTLPQVYSSNFPDSSSRFLQVIEGDSGSASTIWLDYFSLRDHETSANTALESSTSKECLNDTDLENRNCRENTSELGSELGDGLLSEDELNQPHANVLADIMKSVTGFEEITADAENLERRESDDAKLSGSAFVAKDEPVSAKDMYSSMESEDSGEDSEIQDEVLDDSYSNSSGNESVAMKSGDGDSVEDISKEDLGGEWNEKIDAAKEVKVEAADAQRRRVVWWKVPFQVLRYCFLRASPAWSFSVAAAFMGIVFLGRRFYIMKRKTKSLQLKIAVDDKVSQFVDRAARLNEAFSVVRRVPVVRASLTGAGANSWPAMSMR
ncbi:uncharacterized protein LOC111020247 isoform X2 [Momordica charantia]|uniref:Uncharacterized protein LOC111020247 isoform X2 n=1 Tax=Momordica charantia TaxID=3673 RepID=A0A6J1DGC2_MOMCH|nr:uncharacterized protein LOC111020247 isoform X2 [Momordica charantia]